MTTGATTSLSRVLTTLGHREPDRVPLFLLLTMHGAKELGLPIGRYFSDAASVAAGQIRLLEKFGHDCLYPFFYAAIETEAFGGDVQYVEDGPPNAGRPLISHADDIFRLELPAIGDAACLRKVLDCEQVLKAYAGDRVPIIGVVMAPFSLPVMQMGFERYLELMYERRDAFDRLMQINEQFTVDWANAQLAAGATAICYFDPVSSPTVVPPDLYRELGQPVAARTIAQIKGPTATHFASGRARGIIPDVAATGTAVLGASCIEDLGALKAACRGRLTVLGNLNAVEMRHWSASQTDAVVKAAIAAAGPGGGFILSDAHGEIPWQVPDDVLHAVVESTRTWGQYPLTWAADREDHGC
jgi:uroporphyrinogen decarboxylase